MAIESCTTPLHILSLPLKHVRSHCLSHVKQFPIRPFYCSNLLPLKSLTLGPVCHMIGSFLLPAKVSYCHTLLEAGTSIKDTREQSSSCLPQELGTQTLSECFGTKKFYGYHLSSLLKGLEAAISVGTPETLGEKKESKEN